MFQTVLVAIIHMLIANCPGKYNPHKLQSSYGLLSVCPTQRNICLILNTLVSNLKTL